MSTTSALALFKFQQEDVDKLKSKRSRLVGNDPGTGKTYVAIALDQLNRAGDGNAKVDHTQWPVKKTLIIAPKNVLDVWDEHCMELTDEDVFVYKYNTRDKFMAQAKDPKLGGYFIINYESCHIKDMEGLKKVDWFHIIADECHRIKNRKALHTRAIKQFPAIYKTAMSGTPADNRPEDIWSILNWLWPNYYTSYNRFIKAYTYRIKTEEGYSKIVGINEEALPQFHAEVDPWFVRRRKKDVLPDLPDKYYSRLWVELGPKQRRAYDEMRKTMVAWCESHKDEIMREDPIIAQAVVVQLIRLQQFSAGYLVPLLDENGNQVYKIRRKKHKDGTIEEIPTPQWEMTDPSAKLDALMELLEDRGDEQIIIFSQSKAVINLLAKRLEKADISYGLLTGDVKQEVRDQYIKDFQAGRRRVFAGTIKAGGVGITLTAASTVVFIDRWWSPSINLQAEDRAHRIGQTEAVEIIDIMARNTVDLGRYQQIATKWEWLQKLMGDEVDAVEVIKELDLKQVLEQELGVDITEEEDVA